ncbi:hypothetical protein [Spartinivicinus ruber]|uniref:hypothetical protein n=1 Tax=Spartinivicinus ruber TaxID=2683272 RepID=UPI0013D03C26|nr:hypothetical protein [Spartinivicinus ruber]
MSNSEHSNQPVKTGQQSSLTSDIQKLSSKQVQRRKLLKASAVGAPLVLTLRSGAALAATSATCDMKLAEANLPDPDAVVSEQDGMNEEPSWVRAMGTKYTYTPTNGEPQMIVEVNNTLYELNLSQQLIQAMNQNQLAEWEQAVTNNEGELSSEQVSVLVYFDDMQQMSVEYSPGTSPLTNSCWVSIQPTP